MKFLTLILVLVVVVIGVFAAVNWSVLLMPTALSFVVTTVQAPLGLIMLGLMAILAALFLIYLVYMQTSVLLEARRHARELQQQRGLADQAEASRFTELRAFLDTELVKLRQEITRPEIGVMARLDRLEHELRAAVEQNGNTLAAYIGELDDRLARKADTRTLTKPV